MEEEDDFVNKECYYKKEADDAFFNYSVHGLNIEGIKKYCLNPVNSKYNKMMKLNREVVKVIEDSKLIQEERKKKFDINNRYDEGRLIKMYATKKNDNNNETLHQRFHTLNNKYKLNKNINININNSIDNSKAVKIFDNNNLNKTVDTNENKIINLKNSNPKEEIKQNVLITYSNSLKDFSTNNSKSSAKYKILSKIKNRNKNFIKALKIKKNVNSFYSLRNRCKINEKAKSKESFPPINPRKIIIGIHLANSCGVEDGYKNLGHNNYMGSSFDPYNYAVVPKNRISRNIYGNLFVH